MKIQVRYFAALREALGAGEALDVRVGTTLGELRDVLSANDDVHGEVLGRPRAVRGALDQTLAEETTVLHDGAEVAFFPPVTGG